MLRATIIFLLTTLTILACVNTSYSRKEEKQITTDLTRIISGQFPEHGEAFYLQQVKIQNAALAKDPADFAARNDLAVAFIKLKKFDEAEKEFLRIDREEPNLYKTHANLGVLYKKTEDYTKAAEHTKKALKIRPEGHLGLGDYYLRMLDWRAKKAWGARKTDLVNFLGIRWDDGPEATTASTLVNREHLITLIKADRHFASTYVILGDVLLAENDLQNAARAYLMAQYLEPSYDDPLSAVINSRMERITDSWRIEADKNPDFVYDPSFNHQIEEEFANAEGWLAAFQQLEGTLINEGVQNIDFAYVLNEMSARQHPAANPSYLEAGLYRGEASQVGEISHYLPFTIMVLVVLVIGTILFAIIRGIYRTNRARKAIQA